MTTTQKTHALNWVIVLNTILSGAILNFVRDTEHRITALETTVAYYASMDAKQAEDIQKLVSRVPASARNTK